MFFIFACAQIFADSLPAVFWEYVANASRSGLLSIFEVILRSSGNSNAQNKFGHLSSLQKDEVQKRLIMR